MQTMSVSRAKCLGRHFHTLTITTTGRYLIRFSGKMFGQAFSRQPIDGPLIGMIVEPPDRVWHLGIGIAE
jgi:hypothetical protein